MKSKKFNCKLVIGDWSQDGHNKYEYVHFETSHDDKTIKKGYNDFVKKHNIALHDSDEKGHGLPKSIIQLLSDYEDNIILTDTVKILETAGVDFNNIEHDDNGNGYSITPDGCACLFMEMVKTQVKGFTYKVVKDATPPINGFWSKDFNHGFGYGCFD